MSDSPIADRPAADGQDPAYEIARELVGILPFGARSDTVGRCARLTERVESERAVAVVVEAIESLTGPVHLPGHHGDPLAPAVVRRMLHVLLATRDLGWPGTDAPLSVRRVAAADLFFDDTQTVLSDHDWKGPNGVEFALLTALAGQVYRTASRRAATTAAGEGRARDAGGEMLGQLHRVRRPRGL